MQLHKQVQNLQTIHFCTIDPNVGIVEVPDPPFRQITELVEPKKTVPTAFEFTDIAGIVKGASKGEGLGNKFLISYSSSRCDMPGCTLFCR